MKFVRFLSCVALTVMTVASVQAQSVVRLDPETGVPVPQVFQLAVTKEMPEFWGKRLIGYITTKDGTRLRYSVLLPRGGGRHPVILSINGYDAGAIGGISYRKYLTAMSPDIDRELLAKGYAVMGLSPRGTGCSGGDFNFQAPPFGADGAEAVEWAAAQDWSNGAIGMINWSYGGSSQVATAAERPPHLKAIVPGMVLGDYRQDTGAPGGVPAPGFVNTWRQILYNYWDGVGASAKAEGDDQCVTQVGRNKAAESDRSVALLNMRHPLRDATSATWNVADNADRINIPVLSFESFQDGATGVRASYYQEKLDPAKTWIVQSNGDHDIYMSTVWRKIFFNFLDRFVAEKQNGFERTPHTTLWMESFSPGKDLMARVIQTAPRWVISRPGIGYAGLEQRELHLGVGGTLAATPSFGSATVIDHPTQGPTINDFEANLKWGPQATNWRTGSAAYTTAPLADDVLIYGPASLDLWVAGTASDGDIQATVTEVRPDGQEMYVQRGWLRLSNRAIDPARSTPTRPIHFDTPDQLRPLDAGVATSARIEIQKLGHLFRKGSRLRIWIDAPSDTGGFSFDVFTQPQKLYILNTAKYDSVLRFNTIDPTGAPAALAACGSVLSQPCRPDPLAAR